MCVSATACHAQAFTLCEGEIAVDVTLGVDEQRIACALTANQIGVLGEFLVDDLANQHGGARLVATTADGGRVYRSVYLLAVAPSRCTGYTGQACSSSITSFWSAVSCW